MAKRKQIAASEPADSPPVAASEQDAPDDARTLALRAKILKLLAARERGKRAYSQAAALQAELLSEMRPDEPVALDGGRRACVVDNFATRNICFKTASFARYDIEVTV